MTYEEKKLQEANYSRMVGYCVLFKETDGVEEYMRLSDRIDELLPESKAIISSIIEKYIDV